MAQVRAQKGNSLGTHRSNMWSSLLAMSHPPKLPERKRSFVFSACSWLLLLLWDSKNKASFESVFILRCVFSSSLIQYWTSKKRWDTTDFPVAFTTKVPRRVWKKPVDIIYSISCFKQNLSWSWIRLAMVLSSWVWMKVCQPLSTCAV